VTSDLVFPMRPMLDRPSLLHRLAARFECRVTVVVAGPGFGKTSLLAQAFADNARSPRGSDLWLSCQPSDASASLLGFRLRDLLEVPGAVESDIDETARALADAIWTRAPMPVALLLDDVHHLPAGGAAAELVARLLDALPANGHLVMATRAQPPVPLARLTALGQVAWLDEADLRFSQREMADFARLRSVSHDALEGTAGWPALAELAALTDRSAPRQRSLVADFLWEEVLAAVEPGRRHDLALLAGAGDLDAELAAVTAGHRLDLDELMAALPLISRAGDRYRIHPLWEAVLERKASAEERAEAHARAAELLCERGDLVEAMRLSSRWAHWPGMRMVIRAACAGRQALWVPPDALRLWLDSVPERHGAEPETLLLAAIVSVGRSPWSAGEHFEAAVAAFRAVDDMEGELAALTHWSTLAFRQGDNATFAGVIARASELAALGLARAEDQVRLGQATFAYLAGDWRELLATLDPLREAGLPRELRSLAALLRAQARLGLGEIAEADTAAELATELAGRLRSIPGKTRVIAMALTRTWPETLAAVRQLIEDTREAGWPNSIAGTHAQAAIFDSRHGDRQALKDNLATAEGFGPELTDRTAAVTLGFARVLDAILDGDETRAAALMRAELDERPLGAPNTHLAQLTNLALPYVLVAETRQAWDAADLPAFWIVSRSIARALVALRERGDPAEAESLRSLRPEVLRLRLPVSWTVELVVAASATAAEARALLEELGPDWPAWVQPLTTSRAPAVAARARRLLALAGAAPPHRIAVSVLGPAVLSREGDAVDDPNWRRPKVRALLLYLVVHPHPRRDQVIDDLWPALDLEAGRRNLRFTLACLQRVLEPDRRAGEPPFFLRPEGDRLRLTGGDHLDVDAWTFQRRLDEAERAGSPAAAVATWLTALPLRRGPFLADLPYAEWAVGARDEMEGRFVAAAVRAGELLASSDPARALDLAGRALEVDRYCERAYRVLAAAHHAGGDRVEARRVLARCRAALRELGAQPAPETLTLERLAAGDGLRELAMRVGRGAG
jgi:LuxR family maltose regulon positive regulatory protein